MEKTVLRHKKPYIVKGSWYAPMILHWYHDKDELDLHIQHFIHGDFESAEVTTHVYFGNDYVNECEEVPWDDVPKVVREEFQKAWKARAFNPS